MINFTLEILPWSFSIRDLGLNLTIHRADSTVPIESEHSSFPPFVVGLSYVCGIPVLFVWVYPSIGR